MKRLWRRLKTQTNEFLLFPLIVRDLKARQARLSRRRACDRLDGVIVSFTSMPSRLSGLHLTVRSLLLQSVKPEKIVLYLGEDEMAAHTVPENVSGLVGGDFEIRYCSQTRGSYDKLVYALDDFADKTIVTCDDDKIYPFDWLAGLGAGYRARADMIQCHFAREMPLRARRPYGDYLDWPEVNRPVSGTGLLALGVGGVLYPPGSLHEDCRDFETFMRLAPRADDLWFKFMALRRGTLTNCCGLYANHPPSRPTHWDSRLANTNVFDNGNLEAFELLMNAYGDELAASGMIEA